MALNDAVPSSATDVFKRNAEDADKLLNASGPVTNRLGTPLASWEQITQSHAAWNNRGAWVTATAYAVNDIWEDGGVWYVVLSAYTSGASAAADIAGPNIAVLNGNFGSAATKDAGTGFDQVPLNADIVYPVDSVQGLAGLVGTQDDQQINLKGWYADSGVGGGVLYWDAARPKSEHNGGTVFSPTVPYSATTSDYLDGIGETDPTGLGCWIKQESNEFNTGFSDGTPHEIDILVVYGQSNARGYAGSTTGVPEYNTENVVVWNGTTVEPLTSYTPTQNDGVSTGSMWPSFCNEYAKQTDRRALLANCAKGSQSVADLSKGAANTNYSGLVDWVSDIKTYIATLGLSVGNISVIYWQGEQDAQLETNPATYKTTLETLWADLKLDTGASDFNIITVGSYSLTTVRQSIPIQNAQRLMARDLDDVKIIYDRAQALGSVGMKVDTVHLNQQGYNTIGTLAARNYVETLLSNNSQESSAYIDRFGKLNLDGSQDWELFGGRIFKAAVDDWQITANSHRAASGLFSVAINGSDELEITLCSEVDYILSATATVMSQNNAGESLVLKIDDDIHTNVVNGRSVATLGISCDINAVCTDMATGAVTTGLQDSLLDDAITITNAATGVVNISHPEIRGVANACVYESNPRLISAKTTSNTATQVRMYDSSGTLINGQFSFMLPSSRITQSNLNTGLDICIEIIAAKKSNNF
ncbi:sialate O-acetylesterase [uncultured Alteromonas sp.]|uniref:sialate O-acetylesterase n=1 Tax=uncultured Alteromonas sp. TaxID=179113 RepID=UPI0030EB645E|tara:strand:+ start:94 stop:2202 length:2109 start_codon:yes stop_codon:yes gene_type:complete